MTVMCVVVCAVFERVVHVPPVGPEAWCISVLEVLRMLRVLAVFRGSVLRILQLLEEIRASVLLVL